MHVYISIYGYTDDYKHYTLLVSCNNELMHIEIQEKKTCVVCEARCWKLQPRPFSCGLSRSSDERWMQRAGFQLFEVRLSFQTKIRKYLRRLFSAWLTLSSSCQRCGKCNIPWCCVVRFLLNSEVSFHITSCCLAHQIGHVHPIPAVSWKNWGKEKNRMILNRSWPCRIARFQLSTNIR